MKIQIIKPGLFSTVQDLGRMHYLGQGIPVSGAMDDVSMRLANMTLGNSPQAAVLEFTYAQTAFRAESDLLIAYAGGGAYLQIKQQTLPAYKALFIPKGSQVSLQHHPHGVRTYLAIAGGWDVPDILKSKSTYTPAQLGGLLGRTLKKGDYLTASPSLSDVNCTLLETLRGKEVIYPKWSVHPSPFFESESKTIRIVPGKEFTWFEANSLLNFLTDPHTLSIAANRMGYRFEEKKFFRSKQRELLSTAVSPGTIQVSHDGSLILLMADSQTTGGYPRIAQVAKVDIPLCAQLKPGEQIFFSAISRHEAEKQLLQREKELQKLASAIHLNTFYKYK